MSLYPGELNLFDLSKEIERMIATTKLENPMKAAISVSASLCRQS